MIPLSVSVAPEWVIVPALIANSPLLPMFVVPEIEKLLEVDTVAESATVNPLNVSVPAFDTDPPLFIVMAPPEGAKVDPVPFVSTALTAKLAEVVTVPPSAVVRLLKVRAPEFAIEDPSFIVIVPPDGSNTALAPFVSVPLTAKLAEVVTVAEPAVVKPLNVRVPLFTIDEPSFIVMVPPEGSSTAFAPLVSAPPTAKLEEVVTVADPAVERLLKVRDPEFAIELPSFMVIVPPDGAKVEPADATVNVPPIAKELEVETVAEATIVRLLNVSVPPELVIDELLFMVIVPPDGVNVPLVVNAPPIVAVLVPVAIEPLTVRFPYVRSERTWPVPV